MERQYVPGDIATGEILGEDNQWHPDPLSDIHGLHNDALARLEQELLTDEDVCVVIRGTSNQAMIGTQTRVFVYKKGWMAGASFGTELTSFSYVHLSGVQLHQGMVSGAVVLQGSGLSGLNTNYWKQGDSDPHKAPNAIPVVKGIPLLEEGVARLRQLIHQAQHPQPQGQAPVAQQPSAEQQPLRGIADEIRKLAEMRKEGLLSDDEFKVMSAHVLAQDQ